MAQEPLTNDNKALEEVVVRSLDIRHKYQDAHSISDNELLRLADKDIAQIMSKLPGISVLRAGIGISKPIAEGMYGNRLDVLNQGIVQAGQEWGNDHAPEMDVFAGTRIRLLKGVEVLPYSLSLGGVLLSVEPTAIVADAHIRANADYILSTNNFGSTLHASVEKHNPVLPFRIHMGLRKMGDSKAPNYWLTNTGKEEYTASLLVEKHWKQWDMNAYYSFFNTRIAILRGSHLSNLSDLQRAFHADTPYFTNPYFSFNIDNPQQAVSHHLLKASVAHHFTQHTTLTTTYALQLNERQEFDIRRGGRSNIPALYLIKQTHLLDAHWHSTQPARQTEYQGGLGLRFIQNTNQPETGILPLIPDYNAIQGSIFFSVSKKIHALTMQAGLRLEHQQLRVAKFLTTPLGLSLRNYLRENTTFHLASNITYEKPQRYTLTLIGSLGLRSPAINEWYSQGLHQGIAGIEEGNDQLVPEFNYKLSLIGSWNINPHLHLHANMFLHRIDHYIYLQVQPTPRLTIRGAFPLYIYQQSGEAYLYGGEMRLAYTRHKWELAAKFTTTRGDNILPNTSTSLPLVNMPSDELSADVVYQLRSENTPFPIRIRLSPAYVFQQHRLLPEQDFLSPPVGYFLLNVGVQSTLLCSDKYAIDIVLSAQNLLNQSYRNYLNKLRYFADETGLNITLAVHFRLR